MSKLVPGKNDLLTCYPEIAKSWAQEKNGTVSPVTVVAHSNKKYWWKCDKGHEYEMSVDKRVRGQGCPYCSNNKLLVGFNDLNTRCPDIAKQWDYDSNVGTPEDYVYSSSLDAAWICSTCGKRWNAKICSRTHKGSDCPTCAAKKRGEKRHKQALETNGQLSDEKLLAEWDYEKNNLPPSEYTECSNVSVNWICSVCGHHFSARISNRILLKHGCPCCANKKVVAGINDLATTHPQVAKEWHPIKNGSLQPTDVTYGSGKKVWWKCQEGHEYQATVLHRTSGTNCPICNSGRQTSFAEQAVFFYVKKLYPDAVNRYKASFLGEMELDIYIPSINLAIEYDGEAWHKSDKYERELKKYQICHKQGIKLLRLREKQLPTDRYIQDYGLSIAGNMYEHKKLEKVIHILLDNIDTESNMWTRKKATNFHSAVDVNIDRDEIEIRSYMTKITDNSFSELHPDIAKEWHPTKNGALTPNKVKSGSDIKVWWQCPACGNNYMASISHRVSGTGCPQCGKAKQVAKRSKAVQMIDLKSGEVICTFPSISEASRQMKISSGNISAVCKNERKQAGGYYWKYEH